MRRFLLASLTSLIALSTPLSALAQEADSPVLKQDNQIQEVKAANVSEDAVTSETKIVAAQTASASIKNYTAIMRDLNAQRKNAKTSAALNEKGLKEGETAQLTEEAKLTEEEKTQLNKELDDFISAEEKRLDKLNVPRDRARAYFKRVERLHQAVDPETTGALGKLWQQVREKLGYDPDGAVFEEEKSKETRMPAHPARFSFPTEIPKVQTLGDITVAPMPGQDTKAILKILGNKIKFVQPVSAEDIDPYLPTLADVQADNVDGQTDKGETIINAEIRDLAADLAYNPVKIFNFVRENITYEPYYGAKKGSIGCLQERVCNDADSASLTIALMRASGIPARYKKSAILVETSRLKQLLGVDEVKTVFAAFASNKVPVYVVTGGQPSNLDEANLENEQYLALEWTFPQLFYDYDARGGNITNFLQWSDTTSTAVLQTELIKYPTKQWLSLDTIVKPYSRTKNEIVADTAGWNADSFFTTYLQYQGDLSPLDKYVKDLQTQTGKDITQTVYQSSHSGSQSTFNILPPTLPYFTGSGVGDGVSINPETWSKLPDARRAQVTIELKREANNETVLTKTFFASVANNLPLDLSYIGMTAADEATIDSYGGIHATPAELVQIKPALVSDTERTDGTTPLQIGESLVLQFTYQRADGSTHTDQKFAVAGNSEGIYMIFSRVGGDSALDDATDPNYASKILLAGNAAIARAYIKQLQESADTIARSLDYTYQTDFTRAVITQNRVLNTVNGVPSTFDFKGLTIDAGAVITDYSNRGNYKTHRKDFRLLWGLQASHYEGQLFTDLAGLESISTVIGLQHAYAHPETYTVHTITSANESVIDTLALSNNTKANMHADVLSGHTVYTPDKPVSKGTFTGILYISLTPDWTGTYAIGEQTGSNGGHTTDEYQIASYNVVGMVKEYAFKVIQQSTGKKYFAYEDMPKEVEGVKCFPDETAYNSVKSDSGWNEKYGFPCAKGESAISNGKHTYILASNGAKFISDKYASYWITRNDIFDKIDAYIKAKESAPEDDPSRIVDGLKYKSKFSTIIGTYLLSFCDDEPVLSSVNKCYDADQSTIYYVPGDAKGSVHRATGSILAKLDKNKQALIKVLGLPTGDLSNAATSGMINEWGKGRYQNYLNGQMYQYLTYTYYTFGKTYELHNDNGGTGGELGFPLNDPQFADNGSVYQTFENDKEIEWLKSGNASVVKLKKYRCELYGDVTNQLTLEWYMVSGILDVGINAVEDVGSFLMGLFNGLIHPTESAKKIKEALQQFDVDEALDSLGASISQSIEDAKQEYSEAFGPSGCEARQNYLSGRLAGEAALFVIPTTKISKAVKLKFFTRLKLAIPGLKVTTKLSKFGKLMQLTNANDIIEWNKIKTLSQVEKGAAGEEFWKRFVPSGRKENFDTSLGKRGVDVWDEKNRMAYEVKNYSDKVPKSSFIENEIEKDLHLMNTDPDYRPVWVFLDQGPTVPLGKMLEDNGIEYILLTN